MTVTFLINRKEKVKIGKINFVGNEQFNDKRLRRTFKKTHQKSINFFKGTKLNENDYEAGQGAADRLLQLAGLPQCHHHTRLDLPDQRKTAGHRPRSVGRQQILHPQRLVGGQLGL